MKIAERLAPLLLSVSLAFSAQLRVHLDAPARVYLTDTQGRPYFPPGTIVYDKTRADGVFEKHFVPPNSSFSIHLPAGQYRLTIERGKEFVPFSTTLDVPAEGVVHRTIRLQRWVDMAARGWYSADMHVHRPLRDMAAILAPEDLNVAIPITRWKTNQKEDADPDLAWNGHAPLLRLSSPPLPDADALGNAPFYKAQTIENGTLSIRKCVLLT